MKSIIDFMVEKKNAITNAIGFVFALGIVLQPYFAGKTPDLKTIGTAIFGFLIAWFTGKYPKPTL